MSTKLDSVTLAVIINGTANTFTILIVNINSNLDAILALIQLLYRLHEYSIPDRSGRVKVLFGNLYDFDNVYNERII